MPSVHDQVLESGNTSTTGSSTSLPNHATEDSVLGCAPVVAGRGNEVAAFVRFGGRWAMWGSQWLSYENGSALVPSSEAHSLPDQLTREGDHLVHSWGFGR